MLSVYIRHSNVFLDLNQKIVGNLNIIKALIEMRPYIRALQL